MKSSFASACSDTIRIDGKLVIVEQVETDYIEKIEDGDPPSDNYKVDPDKYFQLIVSPFVSRVGMKNKLSGNSLTDNRGTVNEFLNKNFENSFGIGLGAELGIMFNERVSLITGLNYNFTSFKSKYFTELDLLDQDEAMYDEFIGFYIDSDGDLFQQVRFFVDDLAFKDSLVRIDVSTGQMRVHEFNVPILVEFKSERSNKNKLHFSGAIGPMIRFNFYDGTLRNALLNNEGDFSPITMEDSEFRKILPLIHFRGGIQYRLSPEMSLIGHCQASLSLNSADNDHPEVEVYQQELGLGLGIRWYLSKKNDKVETL